MAKVNIVATDFGAPTGIAFNRVGEMFVSNWSSNTIYKVGLDGQKTIFYSGISSPAGIVFDNANRMYVASYSDDYILQINENGETKIVCDGLQTPTGLALSQSGDLLITNRSTGEIIALDLKSGLKKVIATGLTTPVGVTELADGSLVVSQYSGRLTLIMPDGVKKELGADFVRPGVGIVTKSNDTVVVIDNGAGSLRQVNVRTGKTQLITQNLPGAVALAIDKNNLYVGTWSDGTVRVINNGE